MKKVGCAVIGLGFIGSKVHVPSLKGIKEARLVAVSDVDEKRLKRAAKPPVKGTTDYHEILEDPDVDAVWVCLPNFLHGPVTLEALEKGKNVFCEMPLSNSLDECERIVKISQQMGKVVVPGATFRWTPNFVKVRELMENGRVGSPTMFYQREYIAPSILAAQWPAGCWAWDREKSGGTSFTLSVWAIDLMRWLLESEVEKVYASITRHRQEKYGGITPENCQFHVTFKNGVRGVFERSENSPRSLEGSELRILYDDNTAVVALDNDVVELHNEEYEKTTWKFFETGTRVWGHQQLDRHFVHSLISGTEPAVTAIDGLRAVEVATAMARSADTGEVIRL
ncbi:MAG: Gfo/Idh/MocA family protein [Candidatus Thorarchaeota archaeon]